MKDFTFSNPVQAVFGMGILEKLAEITAGKKVLLVSGMTSAKENGSYDAVLSVLKEAGAQCIDYTGIPVCTYDAIAKGVEIARDCAADTVIGMGGAAVMDTAKAIAFCALHENYDDYLTHKLEQNNKEKLRLILIPTYPSTGSEANGTSDIMGYAGGINKVYADYSLLYPPFTYSLDSKNTAYSTLVLLSQTGYRYFVDRNPISRKFNAGSLRSVLEAYEVLLEDPQNYDARGVMLWASFMETSGVLGLGIEDVWTYSIFSANGLCRFTIDTSYREGLSVMFPRWMVWAARHHEADVCDFAVQVMGADPNLSADEQIRFAYEKIINIAKRGGLPTTLDAYGEKPTSDAIEQAMSKISSREFSFEEYREMVWACYSEEYPGL